MAVRVSRSVVVFLLAQCLQNAQANLLRGPVGSQTAAKTNSSSLAASIRKVILAQTGVSQPRDIAEAAAEKMHIEEAIGLNIENDDDWGATLDEDSKSQEAAEESIEASQMPDDAAAKLEFENMERDSDETANVQPVSQDATDTTEENEQIHTSSEDMTDESHSGNDDVAELSEDGTLSDDGSNNDGATTPSEVHSGGDQSEKMISAESQVDPDAENAKLEALAEERREQIDAEAFFLQTSSNVNTDPEELAEAELEQAQINEDLGIDDQTEETVSDSEGKSQDNEIQNDAETVDADAEAEKAELDAEFGPSSEDAFLQTRSQTQKAVDDSGDLADEEAERIQIEELMNEGSTEDITASDADSVGDSEDSESDDGSQTVDADAEAEQAELDEEFGSSDGESFVQADSHKHKATEDPLELVNREDIEKVELSSTEDAEQDSSDTPQTPASDSETQSESQGGGTQTAAEDDETSVSETQAETMDDDVQTVDAEFSPSVAYEFTQKESTDENMMEDPTDTEMVAGDLDSASDTEGSDSQDSTETVDTDAESSDGEFSPSSAYAFVQKKSGTKKTMEDPGDLADAELERIQVEELIGDTSAEQTSAGDADSESESQNEDSKDDVGAVDADAEAEQAELDAEFGSSGDAFVQKDSRTRKTKDDDDDDDVEQMETGDLVENQGSETEDEEVAASISRTRKTKDDDDEDDVEQMETGDLVENQGGETEDEEGAPEYQTDDSETEDLDGPAHEDNFVGEVEDQADPEFKMMSGGDSCIDWDDSIKPLKEQRQKGAACHKMWTQEEKTSESRAFNNTKKILRMIYNFVDVNGDDCVNKTEFRAAGEMEGPPPGFEQKLMQAMSQAELIELMELENKYEFTAIDSNCDGKLSRPEAYQFVSDHMPQADLNAGTLKEIFDEADDNSDNFISYQEFLDAGRDYEGDGDEMEEAEPMAFIKMKERNLLHPNMMKKPSLHGIRMPKRRHP